MKASLMRKGRKLIAFLLVFALFPTGIIQVAAAGRAASYERQPYRYFYSQLEGNAKGIYDALDEMWQQGLLEKGEDYDLTENGKVSDVLVTQALNGNNQLLDEYVVARDAFQYDNPEVFYVDWSQMSVRIMASSSDGKRHAILGKGRSDTYLLRTFTKDNIPAAVKKFEEKIDTILEDLPQEAAPNETLHETQAKYVHDYLTQHMVYHYEDQVENKNCNARTSFDALNYEEGVCEAYGKAYKVLMDRIGIPTVCVYGVWKINETQSEPHLWNYTQLEDGLWYGVDVTNDDPSIRNSNERNSGKETREYCLIGATELAPHHAPSGYMSGSNYFAFSYPELSENSVNETITYADGDLKVRLQESAWNEDGFMRSGDVMVSYKGEDYTRNAEKGNYILATYTYYDEKTGKELTSEWSYLYPGDLSYLEPREYDEELGYYMRLPFPHILAVQFAVTNIPPTFKMVNGRYEGSLYYQGNPNLLSIVSEKVVNKFAEGYAAPPYPETTTPRMNGQLDINKTYHVKTVYDQILVPDGSNETPRIVLTSTSFNADIGASTGVDYSTVSELKWTVNEDDATTTLEYDFTPSQQYADNYCYYEMNVKGLIGKFSQKEPFPVSYGVSYPCAAYAFKAQGFDWNVMGQPQLLDAPKDNEADDWIGVNTETGEQESVEITDQLSHRMTLVVTEPTAKKSKEMTDLLEEKYDEDILSSQTYNIALTLCKSMIVKTGQGVRVCVGFPKGYSYEDFGNGTTFKAYHYIADPLTGTLTGEVEELDVVVTELGLIITCNSFSPFTIAAVASDESVPVNKTAILTTDGNGNFYDGDTKLSGVNANLELTPDTTGDSSKKIVLKADEGYDIATINVDGNLIPVEAGTSEQEITLDYEKLSQVSAKVYATFVEKTVSQEDEDNGFVIPTVTLQKADIEQDEVTMDAIRGKDFSIEVPVTTYGSSDDGYTHTYQWSYQKSGDNSLDLITQETGELKEGSQKVSLKISKDADNFEEILNAKWYLSVTSKKADQSAMSVSNTITVSTQDPMTVKIMNGESEVDKDTGVALKIHGTADLTAEINRSNVGTTWESDNKEIVTVDNSGSLFGVKDGTAHVTAHITSSVINRSADVTFPVKVSKVPVSSVKLDTDSVSLKVGQQKQFVATVEPDDATYQKVIWSVESGKEFVDIDDNGMVTAKAVGKATIKAKTDANEESAIATVEVLKTPVTSVSTDQISKDLTMLENTELMIHANAVPADATNAALEWETSDDSVVALKVDGNNATLQAKEYAAGKNTCTVTVKSKDNPDAKFVYNVTVTDTMVPVTDIEITQPDKDLQVGDSYDFEVTIHPDGATYHDVKWSVDKSDILSLEDSGEVTALAIGTANVTVTVTCDNPECPTHSATCKVNVVKTPVQSVMLDKEKMTLRAGQEDKVSVLSILPENASYKDITWGAENDGIASVKDGVVTAVSVGETVVYAEADGVRGECTVTVEKTPVSSIVASAENIIINDTSEYDLDATVFPEDATNKNVVWSTEDTDVINVSSDGTITPVAAGNATVKVAAEDNENVFDECYVQVVPSYRDVNVYMVDADGNFIPDTTLRLVKVDENGAEITISEVTGYGMITFSNLTDGDYKIYSVNAPNEYENVFGNFDFAIKNGTIGFVEKTDDGESVRMADSFKLTYGSGKDDASVSGASGEDAAVIEQQYQSWLKDNPPSKPDVPEEQDPTPDYKTNVSFYVVDENDHFVSDINLRLVKIENEAETEIATKSGDGKITFENLPDGVYAVYQDAAENTRAMNFISFTIVDGVLYYSGSTVLDSITIVNASAADGQSTVRKDYITEAQYQDYLKNGNPKEDDPDTQDYKVVFEQNSLGMKQGEETDLAYTIDPEDGAGHEISWTSSNDSVVTVDDKGHLIAVGKGTAVIYAQVKGSDVITEVTVTVTAKQPSQNPDGDKTPGENPDSSNTSGSSQGNEKNPGSAANNGSNGSQASQGNNSRVAGSVQTSDPIIPIAMILSLSLTMAIVSMAVLRRKRA